MHRILQATHSRRSEMVTPRGTDTLAIRQHYLRHRAAQRADNRGATAMWLAVGTALTWIFFLGLIGMAH